jgi:hypothetical protein
MRWMILISGLLLSGCYAHYQPRYQGPPPLQSTSIAQANAMVGVQQPAAYKVGFMAGCDSGYLSAGDTSYIFKKDTDRFDTDDVYQQGWNDGFNRCASGEGATANNYSDPRYYGYDYYYPRTFYSGFYYPSYYYAPGYSLWWGYYGYPRHRHYTYNRNYHYTPWVGGHKHKGRGFKKHRGDYYIGKPRGGGHKKGGGGHKKGGNYKSRGKKGGKGSRGYWVR